jgi:hypothetical protein
MKSVPAAAVAAGEHVGADAGLEGGRVHQADQRALERTKM